MSNTTTTILVYKYILIRENNIKIMAFWKKRQDLTENFKIFEEIKILNVKIARIEAEMEALTQLHKNLRGLVNRKLKLDLEENESSIKDDGFNFLR